MKKVVAIILATILIIFCFSGCSFSGYDFLDTNYNFDRAIIRLADGSIIEGKVKQWTDLSDGELTITLDNGCRYLVHNVNVTLIEE